MPKVFITFTDKHKHYINGKYYNENTVAVIKCNSEGNGREKAFDTFGCAFWLCFSESNFNRLKHKDKTLIEVVE